MAYLGENKFFSFRDGFCEALPEAAVSSVEAARLGRTLSRFFNRFSVGCEGYSRLSTVYALCSGLSECGKDVCLCENTELPSFRFAAPLLSADCSVFVSGGAGLRMSFFGKNGHKLPARVLSEIMTAQPASPAGKSGRIYPVTSFRTIYAGNIADSLPDCGQALSAGISCGNKAVRALWLEFFSGCDDSLVFQISDGGQRVNAYSAEAGFISHEKLILIYAAGLVRSGKPVWLPEDFHYAADCISPNGSLIRRYPTDNIPAEAARQRFLTDPLWLCTQLLSRREDFIAAARTLPALSAARREVTIDGADKLPQGRIFSGSTGRVYARLSGKSRISLLAQSYSSEAASELCSLWTEKLRRKCVSDQL